MLIWKAGSSRDAARYLVIHMKTELEVLHCRSKGSDAYHGDVAGFLLTKKVGEPWDEENERAMPINFVEDSRSWRRFWKSLYAE